MAYVYAHRRLDTNSIFYIGIGSDSTFKRAYDSKHRNKYWKNIVNKTDYVVEILHTNIEWETACNYERHFIKEYGRRDLGAGDLVNMTDGGDGLYNPADEVRQKLRYKKSEEHKQLLREYRKGKKASKETIDKRLANGYHQTDEYKIKQRVSHVGKKHTEASKEKMRKPKPTRTSTHSERISQANKGKSAWNKGSRQSNAWQHELEIKALRNDGYSIEALRKKFRCGERIIKTILSN